MDNFLQSKCINLKRMKWDRPEDAIKKPPDFLVDKIILKITL